MTATIHLGDCREIIATLDDSSIDAIVTDPPYELGFMGKKWDNTGIAYDVQLWTQCLRVLKPGGHLLAFGGTRTYHRMTCAIEDAGFEIRDSIHWLYGSGFPKSLDVSKAIDKANGRQFEDRYALGRYIKSCRLANGFTQLEVNSWFGYRSGCQHWESQHASGARVPTPTDYAVLKKRLGLSDEFDDLVARIEAERQVVGTVTSTTLEVAPGEGRERPQVVLEITAPAIDAAREWEGWGTALKPAHEPVVMARKPLIGTVAANVLEHGTGALNIDGARVKFSDATDRATAQALSDLRNKGRRIGVIGEPGQGVSFASAVSGDSRTGNQQTLTHDAGRWPANVITDGSIEAEWVRYFYCAKPSRAERNAGLDALNTHPTVKPLALMRYLVRLVTPPGGTVLEPFAGSGTTLAAAILEGFNVIGCELTADYLPIIEGRIAWAQQQTEPDQESLFNQ